MSQRQKGYDAELRARQFLETQGYHFVAANYTKQFGEIDLIMEDDGILVFIEVKSGFPDRFQGMYHTINARKKQKMTQVAQDFLENIEREYSGCRFDAIFVEKEGCSKDISFTHIQNIIVQA